MFGTWNNIVWPMKQYCFVRQCKEKRQRKNNFWLLLSRRNAGASLFQLLNRTIFWNRIYHKVTYRKYLTALWKRCLPSPDKVYFANRSRIASLLTDLSSGARKGTLKRFVWRFDTLTPYEDLPGTPSADRLLLAKQSDIPPKQTAGLSSRDSKKRKQKAFI